jgi:hypothetical protein
MNMLGKVPLAVKDLRQPLLTADGHADPVARQPRAGARRRSDSLACLNGALLPVVDVPEQQLPQLPLPGLQVSGRPDECD